MTQRDRGQKKMIYRTVTEEDGSKNTTTLRPADLHDDQNGPDTSDRESSDYAPFLRRNTWQPERPSLVYVDEYPTLANLPNRRSDIHPAAKIGQFQLQRPSLQAFQKPASHGQTGP
jgi:hypothetical protein